MNSIDISKPEKVKKSKEDLCPICYDNLGDEQLAMCYKQCKNLFHKDCVDLWTKRSNKCPQCRAELLVRLATIAGSQDQEEEAVEVNAVVDNRWENL